jgi:hypothetical protein
VNYLYQFGHTSLLWLQDFGKTNAQLESEQKYPISHYGKVLRRMGLTDCKTDSRFCFWSAEIIR